MPAKEVVPSISGRLVNARAHGGPMEVVIVASGDLPPGSAAVLAAAELVIAADGGAAGADRLGRRPDIIVGDLDSAEPALIERLGRAGSRVERHPTDKETSDAALAVEAARTAGATRVVLLGALGGERADHAVANLLLLAAPSLAGLDARIVHGPDRIRLLSGGAELVLEGAPGDLVTLLPATGTAHGVATSGLRWALDGADLPVGTTRGLSNEVVEAPASVRLRSGSLFVIEHATHAGGSHP
jgi:thiamine pyrophosphokinase